MQIGHRSWQNRVTIGEGAQKEGATAEFSTRKVTDGEACTEKNKSERQHREGKAPMTKVDALALRVRQGNSAE
jgi:hypothetical protein